MRTDATLEFLGAAGTVTGSMFLVRRDRQRVLLDCGLFQGLKPLRLRNWSERVAEARSLNGVVLSHAHMDHAGYLPLLARQGFRGPVHCTAATADLLRVLLPDAARLQEEEADRANRYAYSKHQPALPLYGGADAQAALELLVHEPYGRPFPIGPDLTGLFRPAGHILGAASVELQVDGRCLVYSGDLGRWDRPILRDPELVRRADVLLLESTYGDRSHPEGGEEALARVVRDAARRGGPLLIPAFAVDRTQELLWMLDALERDGRIPSLPVYLDSPLAIEATEVYAAHPEEHDALMRQRSERAGQPLRPGRYHFTRAPDESKALNDLRGPIIIIAGSGMATGGRILHHLARRLPDPLTTVLLAGFQAAGTRGRLLADGVREIKMLGRMIPVRAVIQRNEALSAHADRDDLLRWLAGFERPPSMTYLVHGEPAAAATLAATIAHRLGWAVRVARDGEQVSLGSEQRPPASDSCGQPAASR